MPGRMALTTMPTMAATARPENLRVIAPAVKEIALAAEKVMPRPRERIRETTMTLRHEIEKEGAQRVPLQAFE